MLFVLQSAQKFGVQVHGVNILAMDYGSPADPNAEGRNAISSTNHTLSQLAQIGLHTSVGIVVLPGKEDAFTPSFPEQFTLPEAREVLRYANEHRREINLLSFWELSWDQECPGGGGGPDENTSLPVLFGAPTPTGNVFVGVELPALPRKLFRNGFRASATVPGTTLAAMSAGRDISRCRVERGDPAWVHGRDHDPQQPVLAQKRVGLVGCGALGSALARFLAQMGVGHFVLVDNDNLTSSNTSRHLLGAAALGENKAAAVAQRLRRDFPDLASAEAFTARFQDLSEEGLKHFVHERTGRRVGRCSALFAAMVVGRSCTRDPSSAVRSM